MTQPSASKSFWERLIGEADHRCMLKWLIAITLLRVIYLMIFPLSLVGDEAYYWEWGRRPDLGYYSKPPWIGWQMGIVHWFGGNSAFWIRLPATLFGSGLLAATYFLGQSMYGNQVGLFAMLLLALTPASTVAALISTIDPPLLFFWSMAMLAFWKVFYQKGGPGWAIVLILCLGLGSLAKQMMLIFPLLGLIVLIVDLEKWPYLRNWKLWTGWIVTLLFLIPPVMWNVQNDWITVEHTGHHFQSGGVSALKQVGRFFEFIIAETFILSPVLYFAGLFLLWKSAKHLNESPQTRFLWIFSAPAILIFFILAMRQRVNPNWPAVFYLPMLLLFVADVLELSKSKLLQSAFWCGGVLTSLTYSLVFITSWLGLEGSSKDVFKRLRGYPIYAEKVHAVLQTLPEPENIDIIVVGHRYHLCQLAFHAPGHPIVHRWPNPEKYVRDQYDIWSGITDHPNRPALLILASKSILSKAKLPVDWKTRYRSMEKLSESINIVYHDKSILYYDLYYALPYDEK